MNSLELSAEGHLNDAEERNLVASQPKLESWSDEDECNETIDGKPSKSSRMNRSMNFTPAECRLLLQCVRDEKECIFTKDKNSQASQLKNEAWDRITNAFNKQSTIARSLKVLKTKFKNMKKMINRSSQEEEDQSQAIAKMRKRVRGDRNKSIKMEPMDLKAELEQMQYDDNSFDSLENGEQEPPYNADPLSTVLNEPCPAKITNNYENPTQMENDEVTKLKLDLLKYQFETAKLERQRVSEAREQDARERESRVTENSLRLRAARLDALAAEMRFPPQHPALNYIQTEMTAQQYMAQFQS